MAPPPSWLLAITLVFSAIFIGCSTATEEDRQGYIVYMGDLPRSGSISVSSLHTSMVEKIVGSPSASKYLLRSYKRSFNGFAVELTKEEAKRVSGMKGVVSVFPNEKKQLLTTRSWDFLGFPLKASRNTGESDIIIGMLDSGIWPESESFSDEGFGPAPSKWKGTCESAKNFTCNNKIIGARHYRSNGTIPSEEYESPRDAVGHGTHTSSTAAGRVVEGASMLGVGSGTARGGVPSARIAIYKICWTDGCSSDDILAAFDDAIADGVDIISISVGASYAIDYFRDPIAIGAFHSMKKGILTSNSAGNSGPDYKSISNCSPWSLSVAASTIDRNFMSNLVLGDNQIKRDSVTLNSKSIKDFVPLIYGGDAPNKDGGYTSSNSSYCAEDSLDKSLVSGKIVICDYPEDEGETSDVDTLLEAEVAGVIFINVGRFEFPHLQRLPTAMLLPGSFQEVLDYLNSSSKPTGKIQMTRAEYVASAPVVAEFSSRGPNPITPDLLSPDVIAPGVDILAAWTDLPLTEDFHVKYNLISGTSMSCPHASGSAAFVKSFHPTWSPAAIKSALITTATPLDYKTSPSRDFGYGAGQINPVKAVNPGLVYDAGVADYAKFLCGQGYSAENLRIITGDNMTCTEATNGTVWDLNLPSLTLLSNPVQATRSFTRTVTNVGSAVSTYRANVTAPGLTVKVQPSVLKFNSIGQKKTFKVTVSTRGDLYVLPGSLVWDDGVFQVRSPIVAYYFY